MAYNDKTEKTTWETSKIRSWLNNEYLNEFSEYDQTFIQDTTLVPDNNPICDCDAGNGTTDKIFLLSVSEVEKYMPKEESRVLQDEKWWLRTSGYRNNNSVCVRKIGTFDYVGEPVAPRGYASEYNMNTSDVAPNEFAVRPAMWVGTSK